MKPLIDILSAPGRITVQNAPEGLEARLLVALATGARQGVVHIARDDQRMAATAEMLQFFAPGLQVLTLPAWDCLPYDRSSPNRQVVAARMRTLGLLAEDGLAGRVLLTTVNAVTQRVPARATVTDGRFVAAIGDRIDEAALTTFLVGQGYTRTGTVMEPGEYAIRGGLIDIFPPNDSYPVRLDLFGQELESIRLFDSMTQRTLEKIGRFELTPVGELVLEPPTVNLFRARYRELFGIRAEGDSLYEAVSESRAHPGMEHWLPIFHRRLETIFDYVGDAPIVLDHLGDDATDSRFQAIDDYYETRQEALKANAGASGVAGTAPRSVSSRDSHHVSPRCCPVPGVGRNLASRTLNRTSGTRRTGVPR